MQTSRRQIVVLALLCVVLVIVAVYRLSGSAGESVVAAQVGETTIDSFGKPGDMAGLEMPSDGEEWDLPTIESLRSRITLDWIAPTDDPFVLPPRMRIVVSPPPSGAGSASQTPELVEVVHDVAPPSFTVRSSYRVSGVWYAEIDREVYRVGDERDGYRIDEIAPDAIWVTALGEDESAPGRTSAQPECVMRVGNQLLGMVDGSWRGNADRDHRDGSSRVGPHPSATGGYGVDTQTVADRRREAIRVQVANGP